MYFTKLKGLATVIWDPENDRPLAEFNREGLCCTKNETIAKQLTDMGYMEVSAEDIKEAGLTLPNIPEKDRGPGRGYTNDPTPSIIGEERGESPMEAYFKSGKKSKSEKGRTIVQ